MMARAIEKKWQQGIFFAIILSVVLNLVECEVGRGALLFSSLKDLQKIDLETSERTLVITGLSKAAGIDYDFQKNLIVWSDIVKRGIYSANMDNGDAVKIIAKGTIITSDDLAVDWIHDNVYWTDVKRKSVSVASLDGKLIKLLFDDNIDKPRAIVVNPLEGLMFWSDWGETAKIERAGMDGSHRSTIISKDIIWPNGLTIEFESKKLYWIDGKLETLSSSDYDGSNIKVILESSTKIQQPFFIDVFEGWLYWTDWKSKSICKVDIFTGKNEQTVESFDFSPTGIRVYHSSKQPPGPNYCDQRTDKCSHFCLPAPRVASTPRGPSEYTCACPDGMVLVSNQNCIVKDFFIDVNIVKKTARNLTQQILNRRETQASSRTEWGKDIKKTAIGLFLEDPHFFFSGNETGEEIAYQLTLQLMSKLVLKKKIATKDLALFVNAMTVACINPEKYFSVNVLAELRKRIDNSNETNPFLFLALCNGGGNMTMHDVRKLQLPLPNHLQSSWTEIQAMTVLALKCISKQSNINVDTTLIHLISELKKKQQNNGTIGNLKTTALVIQALIAAEDYRTNFNVSKALESIVEGMKHTRVGTEEIYYILPVFNWKTLLDINSNHCETFIKTELETESSVHEYPDENIQVQVSIIIGDSMDFTRTWRIKVPPNWSFYDALENISFSEPNYKFQYMFYDGKPYVASLNNFQNSVVDDSFWCIYTKTLSSDDDPVFIKQSPVEIQVKETEEVILWFRSGFREKIL